MKTPIAYEITADTYEACRRKLETVPMDQWPSHEIYYRVLIGVRLYEMEQAEKDELPPLPSASQPKGVGRPR